MTIALSDERLAQLRELAARRGVSAEELARRGVEAMLDHSDAFRQAADYVLAKNAELYRRLAR